MLKGKVCIITGSSAGIGAAVANKFANEKAEGIVLHGRQMENLKKVQDQCVRTGIPYKNVLIIAGDITDESVQQELVNDTVKHFGRIDVLVNNAGIFDPSNVENSNMELFDRLWNTNVRALVSLTKLCLPHMIECKGNIVNLSTGLALKAMSFGSFYGMGKAAIDHFTRSLALEVAPKGLRVNSVNPGYIPGTQLNTRLGATKEMEDKIAELSRNHHPMPKFATADEVADAITWIASRATSTTGSCINVDAGFHIH